MTHYDCFFVSFLGAGSPVPGAQSHQLPLGSLHISPVQTAFEPSSVPYYLQQDLEALHRISQQYASPPLSLQSDSVGQGSLLTTHAQSSGSPRVKRHGRGSRRLSLDPYTKLRVEKLEVVSSVCSFSAVHLVSATIRFPVFREARDLFSEKLKAEKMQLYSSLPRMHGKEASSPTRGAAASSLMITPTHATSASLFFQNV